MPQSVIQLDRRSVGREVPPPPRHRLAEPATRQLAETAGSLCLDDAHLDDQGWLQQVRLAGATLPAVIRDPLVCFGYDSGPAGAMVLGGVPTDRATPATPTVAGSVRRVPSLASAALMLLAQQLGHPVAYRQEKSGALVQDVVPVPELRTDQSNAGAVELLMHTENAFHPYRPDYVLLLCVRADPAGEAGLRLSSVRRALPLLDDRTIATLRQPRFRTSPPRSFGELMEAQVGPVLHGAVEDPDLCVDFAVTKAVDAEATEALARLGRAMGEVTHEIKLQVGDLAVVDNRISVHGRTAYQPRFDGTDRWLHRVYVQVDLRRSRQLRPANGHVLDSLR
ncbi:TauD/TfdA family dioxygenase [Micromonospora mirobrigensis]|uniref:L-asparagine oxygenase n=1 Tax=Micromonospora mirobrigensis TaxID=262898 RepID=A0A1C4ZBP2_9ACTN|nr:TauD/TfdA family dioxygenase [Micromonospora mirobrigensis]SCF30334.1 L-asparagine oxygenase [Micromonospora mirobrigensis]